MRPTHPSAESTTHAAAAALREEIERTVDMRERLRMRRTLADRTAWLSALLDARSAQHAKRGARRGVTVRGGEPLGTAAEAAR